MGPCLTRLGFVSTRGGSDATLIPGFPALPHDGTMDTGDKQSGRRGGEDGMPLKLFVANLEVLVWLAKPGVSEMRSFKVQSDLFSTTLLLCAAGWLMASLLATLVLSRLAVTQKVIEGRVWPRSLASLVSSVT